MTDLLTLLVRFVAFVARLVVAVAFGSVLVAATTIAVALGRFRFARRVACWTMSAVCAIAGFPVRFSPAY